MRRPARYRACAQRTIPVWPLPCDKGESRHHAEVVLAASLLRDAEREREVAGLMRQLTDYLERLARLAGVSTKRLELRIVGH